MARTGQFGRRPRVVQSLSATIVAMLREYNAMRDNNIMSAWERGGEFEGKKVTDAMVLAHWKERRDAVSKEDPLWDYYNNQMLNLEFSIDESKMALKYAEKKVGEGAMASFYRKWAKKSPTDSQAYRNLMIKAAQFMDAARGRAAGSSAAARQAAYNKEMQSNYNRYELSFDTVNGWLLYAAGKEGILTNADEDFLDLVIKGQTGGSDQVRMMGLFDLIYTDPRFAEVKKGLDEVLDGKPLTYEGFLGMFDNKATGLKKAGAIAKRYGDKTTEKNSDKALGELRQVRSYLGDLDVMAEYAEAHDKFAALMESGLAPWEADKVMAAYADELEFLRDNAGDIYIQGLLNNEIIAAREGKAAGPSVYDDSNPYVGSSGKESGDAQSTADARRKIADLDNRAKQGGVWVKDDKSGEWDVIPAQAFGQGTLDLTKGVLLPHITEDGDVKMVYVPTKPVSVEGVATTTNQSSTGLVPPAGTPVKPSDTPVVGRGYIDPFTGAIKMSVVDSNGDEVWHGSSPLRQGADVRPSGDGFVITATFPQGTSSFGATDVLAVSPDSNKFGYAEGADITDPVARGKAKFTSALDVFDGAAINAQLPRSDKEYNPALADFFASPQGVRALAGVDIAKVKEAYATIDKYLPASWTTLDPVTGKPTAFDQAEWESALWVAKTLAPYNDPDNAALRARAAQRVGVMPWTADRYTMERAQLYALSISSMERYDKIEAGKGGRFGIEGLNTPERKIEGYNDPERGFIATGLNTPEKYRDEVVNQVRLAQASEAILLKNKSQYTTPAPTAWAPGRGTGKKNVDWDKVNRDIQVTSAPYQYRQPGYDPNKTVPTPTIRLPGIAAGAGITLPQYLQPTNVPTTAITTENKNQPNPGVVVEPPPPPKPPSIRQAQVKAWTQPNPAKPVYGPVPI